MGPYKLVLVIKASLVCALAPLGAARAQLADPGIAYVGTQGSEANKLVVMNSDGTNGAAIYSPAPGATVNTPTWSPSGTQLAFKVGGSGATLGLWRVDIAVANGKPKGLNSTRLVSGSDSGWEPAWSPTGDRIAFYSFEGAGASYTIQVVPATGGTPTVLYTAPHYLFAPTWSPDASRVAFLEYDPAYDSFGIRLLDIATGVVSTALDGSFSAQFCGGNGGGYRGLDWARTGDVLAFDVGCASRGGPAPPGDTAIYLLDLAGGPPLLAVTPGGQPAWSPDDSSLIFRDIEDSNKLRRVNLSTGAISTFKNKLGRDPDWGRF